MTLTCSSPTCAARLDVPGEAPARLLTAKVAGWHARIDPAEPNVGMIWLCPRCYRDCWAGAND
jgi:hypothetical protein